jgi:hypothetical protein
LTPVTVDNDGHQRSLSLRMWARQREGADDT